MPHVLIRKIKELQKLDLNDAAVCLTDFEGWSNLSERQLNAIDSVVDEAIHLLRSTGYLPTALQQNALRNENIFIEIKQEKVGVSSRMSTPFGSFKIA